MKALDTNVLVRFLVRDDVQQSARARRLFEGARDEPLYVSCVVLAETLWVLESAYGLGRADLANVLEMLLQARELAFEHKDRVRLAVQDFARGLGGFSDCLIGQLSIEAECETTMTFDRGLKHNPTFTLL